MNILDAAVYCGTYHKYNCGRLDGAWLKLADYSSHSAFIAACKELHKDEKDPEFMFQDWENIPCSQIGESYINPEVFTTLSVVKIFPADMVERFITYCEDKGAEQDLSAVVEFLKVEKENKANEPKALFAEVRAEEEKVNPNDKKHVDWCMRQISSVLRLSDGSLLTWDKPKIETSFCFGYSSCGQGPSYEEAIKQESNFGETMFINENLRELERRINEIENLDEFSSVYIGQKYFRETKLRQYQIASEWRIKNEPWIYGHIIRQATYEEVQAIIKIEKAERDKLEKRLRAYLKRYGTSKLKTWTYWMDE